MRAIPESVKASWPAPNYVNPVTHGHSIFYISVTLLFISTLVVGLRLYTRIFIKKWLGWDDGMIILSIVLCYGVTILIGYAALNLGWDRHTWDVKSSVFSETMKYAMAIKLLYVLNLNFIRCSLIIFYYRLIRQIDRIFWRRLLHGSLFFTNALCVVGIFTTIFQCYPISAYWTIPEPTDAHCLDEGLILLVLSIVHNIADLLVVLIPIPLIVRLQMPTRKRVGVLLLMSIGLVATVTGAIRTYLTYRVFYIEWDQTWTSYPKYIACMVEVNLGVICASIPPCNPLVGPLFSRAFKRVSSLKTRNSSVGSDVMSNSLLSRSSVSDKQATMVSSVEMTIV